MDQLLSSLNPNCAQHRANDRIEHQRPDQPDTNGLTAILTRQVDQRKRFHEVINSLTAAEKLSLQDMNREMVRQISKVVFGLQEQYDELNRQAEQNEALIMQVYDEKAPVEELSHAQAILKEEHDQLEKSYRGLGRCENELTRRFSQIEEERDHICNERSQLLRAYEKTQEEHLTLRRGALDLETKCSDQSKQI